MDPMYATLNGSPAERHHLHGFTPTLRQPLFFIRCRLSHSQSLPSRQKSAIALPCKPCPSDNLRELCSRADIDAALDAISRYVYESSLHVVQISFHVLLSSCEKRKALAQANLVHIHLVSYGLDSVCPLGERLVSTFVKCGDIQRAFHLFHMLPQRTVFTWTALITGYVNLDDSKIALEMYRLMQEDGKEPNKFTFISVLKACGNLSDLECGKAVHASAQSKGLDSDPFLGCALVNMYGKCGDISQAENSFYGLLHRDIVSWSAMMSAYLEHRQGDNALLLFRQMVEEGLQPDLLLIVLAIKACCIHAEKEEVMDTDEHLVALKSIGIALHFHMKKLASEIDAFSGSALITMYGKCGDISRAKHVFDAMMHRDIVLWTVMLSVYIEQGQADDALRLFRQMHTEGMSPDDKVFVIILQACSILAEEENSIEKVKALEVGRAVQEDAGMMGYQSDVFIGSSLVTVYGKCGEMKEAEKVFVQLLIRDIILWNSMLTMYVEQGEGERALHLYKQMVSEGVTPDECSLVVALQACCALAEQGERSSKVKSLHIGRALHQDAKKNGLHSHLFVASVLMSMYNKCGSLVDAEKVFSEYSGSNVQIWNAMLTVYVENSQGEKGIQLYRCMSEKNVKIDEITLINVLQACSGVGSLDICKEIHFILVSSSKDTSLSMATTLIHAYGSCGSMADADAIFQRISDHDVVSWNAIISGHAKEGSFSTTLTYFEKMCQSGMKPNELTFLPLLSVCSHAGLLDISRSFFSAMELKFGVTPTTEHYSSMLDLLVRAGDLASVFELFSRMPIEPDLPMWVCLLSACQKHGDANLAKRAFDYAVHLQPKEAAAYIIMSNIYADAGMQEFALEVDNAKCTQTLIHL